MLTSRRKRAKTEDEKEQRRVERVLRNRRAAQSSRERKRQETELLAKRNHQLEDAMRVLIARTAKLEAELKKVRPDFESILPSTDSLTLSQPLFTATTPKNGAAGDEDMAGLSQSTLNLMNSVLNSPNRDAAPGTVNLASISPAPSPVAEEPALEPIPEESESQVPQTVDASTTRSTQYSAAVLCDLQCQRSVEATSPSGRTALETLNLAVSFSTTFLTFLASAISLRQQQMTLISIINMLTRTTPSSSSSTRACTPMAMAQPPTSSSPRKTTLRLKLLRKLLTCNRQLARPLQDATLEVLRLKLTRGEEPKAVAQGEGAAGGLDAASPLEQAWMMGNLPSKERLMSLLLAIRLLERKIAKQGAVTGISSEGDVDLLHETIAGSKRSWVSLGDRDGVITERSCRQRQRVEMDSESADEELHNEVAT